MPLISFTSSRGSLHKKASTRRSDAPKTSQHTRLTANDTATCIAIMLNVCILFSLCKGLKNQMNVCAGCFFTLENLTKSC